MEGEFLLYRDKHVALLSSKNEFTIVRGACIAGSRQRAGMGRHRQRHGKMSRQREAWEDE